MRVLDAKPVNLDGFSVANPELGLVAMRSPYDPEPSLVVADRGRQKVVVELDGKAAEEFDVIDEFITTFWRDRKSTRLNSSHLGISYAVFCLKKKKKKTTNNPSKHPTVETAPSLGYDSIKAINANSISITACLSIIY